MVAYRLARVFFFAVLLGSASLATPAKAAAPNALPAGQKLDDVRLQPLKDLNGYFPLTVPQTADEWKRRADFVRRQVLVALGLWPLPERTPHRAVVHGRIELDDYTVDKVYLESFPGHFVSGSLYKPRGKDGKLPIVLCPHGHWPQGRFLDQGEAAVKKQIADGAEQFAEGGRSPLQARCVQLARMGCLVFHYDMLGYADSQQISYEVAHRYGKPRPEMETPDNWGLFSPQAESWLQSVLGIQSYNSIRALDWLSELPEADASRVAVTGASGGGTQTFLLAAIEPRVTAQFPAVMVSTAMQGGCTCENCSLLRIETGNIELAGLFAPKPLAMSGANDWTKEIMTKGYPELQQLYKLLGKPEHVKAEAFTQFPHNYNSVARHMMYDWFNEHLRLAQAKPIVERDYRLLTQKELTVWDDAHPKPAAGDDYERSLLRTMTDGARQQLAFDFSNGRVPKDFRRVIGGAWQALVGREGTPTAGLKWLKQHEEDHEGVLEYAGLVRDTERGTEVPTIFWHPRSEWNKQLIVWVDGSGKHALYGADGKPQPQLLALVKQGYSIASCDVLGSGESVIPDALPGKNRKVKTERQFAGFTYGYNHPLLVQRVHDILSVIGFAKTYKQQPEKIHLAGVNGAGVYTAVAAAIAGADLDRVALDTAGFRFANLTSFDDAQFVPGAVKYGDLPRLLALIAPRRLLLAGEGSTIPPSALDMYRSAGAGEAIRTTTAADVTSDFIAWITR